MDPHLVNKTFENILSRVPLGTGDSTEIGLNSLIAQNSDLARIARIKEQPDLESKCTQRIKFLAFLRDTFGVTLQAGVCDALRSNRLQSAQIISWLQSDMLEVSELHALQETYPELDREINKAFVRLLNYEQLILSRLQDFLEKEEFLDFEK